MSPQPTDTTTVLSAFTSATMTVERLAYNTMLTKKRVSDALQELLNDGKVSVAGGAWTLLALKKKGSTVTPSPKKAPAKKVAAKKVATPAKSVQAKKETSVKAAAKKVTPAKKATPVKKTAAKKPAVTKPVVKKNAVAAANGAKKHAKVAERDEKILSIIVASKKAGITDEDIAASLGTSLGIAYQSIRRLKDENKIDSSKGDNGVTRRFAV